MNIIVPIKLVLDLVEELEIAPNGAALDLTFARMILNEPDEHAIEQAILIKERSEAQVILIAPDVDGADDALYTAASKGADRLIRLDGKFVDSVNNHALARAFRHVITDLAPDLVLTGVQAHDDLDGSVGPLLAEMLHMPYVGYVAGVELHDGMCVARKEYPGGLIAEMEVQLPAVLGIQAADEPPRYVPISKVRQAMKTAPIEEQSVPPLDAAGGPVISRLFVPERGQQAAMIEGTTEDIAVRLVGIFEELGVL